MIDRLKLNSEQQATIKKTLEDARPTGRGGFGRNMSDDDRKKMREKMEKGEKDSLAVLNDDQMLEWTTMQGKTFKFPERQPGRRGGPNGGGPNGGGQATPVP